MDPEINRSVSRLFRKFLLLQALIFAAALALSLVFTAHFKNRLAAQLASASRDQLLSGDARQVIALLPASMSRDFYGMSWLPAESGVRGFSVPADARDRGGWLRAGVGVRLFYDDAERFAAGELLFYYSRLQALLLAAGAWLVILLLTLPMAFMERARLLRDYDLLLKLRVEESYSSLAAQVAHDIRSPLAALGAAARGGAGVSNGDLIARAVDRIQEITDDLSLRHNRGGSLPGARVADLNDLAGQVMEEKRLQYSGKPGLRLLFTPAPGPALARLEPKELRRAISNLVNNAVEAIHESGAVSVSVRSAGESAELTVSDDGSGIPPELLDRLGRKGETHGKPGGTGLGLFHARAAAERWGGGLEINSEAGRGTTVKIRLPLASGAGPSAAPARAALLDDDDLTHMTWELAAKARGVELLAFRSPAEFMARLPELPKGLPIYIDSDLGGGEKGERLALELHQAGYTDITMATGHSPDKFSGMPWLKVAGKEPPWN